MSQDPNSEHSSIKGVFSCKTKDEVDFFIEDAFNRAGLDTRRGIKDDPLTQIYVSVTSQLNDTLEPYLDGHYFDTDRNISGLSADEVASILMEQCHQNFKRFLEHSSHQSIADSWMHYVGFVQTGVSHGFGEAKDIIESLGGLNPDARSKIARLKEQVAKGMSHLNQRQ